MKKWIQKKLNPPVPEDQNKRRLTRKERYMKQYLNSEKCFHYWETMTQHNMFAQQQNKQSEGFAKQIQTILSSPEQILDNTFQSKLLDLYIPQQEQHPVLSIFQVAFHHKRGSEIEFCYPEMQTYTNDIENITNIVTQYALPDAVHNTDEDYLYFNFKAKINDEERQIYGVTCFKQIKVTEQLKQQNPELTRSHIQKSICLLSLIPSFGYIKNRLEPTIKAYFQLQDLQDMSILKYAFDSISQTFDLKNLEMSTLYTDTNLIGLFWIFKEKVLKILKALQYELKIVVYSLSSSVCSRFIISLLSLIPGLLNFNLQSKASLIQSSYLSNFGLPLKIFSNNYQLFLHFCVNDLQILENNNIQGFILGTTNKLLKSLPKLNADLIIDVDTGEIQIQKETHKKLLNLKLSEKQLFSAINTESLKQIDPTQYENLKKLIPIQSQKITFQGSEDWIRKIIHDYYIKLFTELGYFCFTMQQFDDRINRMTTIRTRKSMIIKQEISPQDSSDDDSNPENLQNPLKLEVKKHKEQLIDELQIKELRVLLQDLMRIIRKHNRKALLYWITKTKNGIYWFKTFDQSIITNSEYFDKNTIIPFYKIFENGDIYLGNMQYGGLIELHQKRAYLGQIEDFIKNGEGKYEKLKEKTFQYKGQFKNNKYHGEGKLIVIGEFEYNGHFENNLFHGYGNLQKQDLIYEGWFKNGQFNGTGKLVLQNKDVYVGQFINGEFQGEGQYVWQNGDIYKGQYKNGKRNGMGIFQDQNTAYEGEWVDDKKDGFGVLTILDKNEKFQGQFKQDDLVLDQDFIIKYSDESIYKGMINNFLPNGKGYLQKKDGKIQEGIFINGIFQENQENNNIEDQISNNKQKDIEEYNENKQDQQQQQQNIIVKETDMNLQDE